MRGRGVPLRAAKAISRSLWNAGCGADSGPSRGDPCSSAIRPFETFPIGCAIRGRVLVGTTNKTEQAYRRLDALARRWELMAAWARYCEGGAGEKVLAFKRPACGCCRSKVRTRPLLARDSGVRVSLLSTRPPWLPSTSDAVENRIGRCGARGTSCFRIIHDSRQRGHRLVRQFARCGFHIRRRFASTVVGGSIVRPDFRTHRRRKAGLEDVHHRTAGVRRRYLYLASHSGILTTHGSLTEERGSR